MAENSKTRAGVIFGGSSVEHEVSVITGIQAVHALRDTGYEALPIYVNKTGKWFFGDTLADIERYGDPKSLTSSAAQVHPVSDSGSRLILQGVKSGLLSRPIRESVDVLLLAMHGSEGENGSLQGLCETLGVPYTGSDVTASAIGMDKAVAKTVCEASGVPVVDSVVIREHEWRGQEDALLGNCQTALGFPMIVKPCRLGSSIGIAKVGNTEGLESAIEDGLRLDEKIVIETCIESLREFNCSVVGNIEKVDVSVIEEPVRFEGADVLSFEQKYQRGGKDSGSKSEVVDQGMVSLDRIIPAKISEEMAREIRELARRVFRTIGCEGVARIDFLFDDTRKQLYFNEINTIPGSFSFYLWEPAGLPFDRLLTRLLDLAFERHRRKLGKIRSYDTDLLSRNALRGVKGKTG